MLVVACRALPIETAQGPNPACGPVSKTEPTAKLAPVVPRQDEEVTTMADGRHESGRRATMLSASGFRHLLHLRSASHRRACAPHDTTVSHAGKGPPAWTRSTRAGCSGRDYGVVGHFPVPPGLNDVQFKTSGLVKLTEEPATSL